jgi:hypothetical protein
MIAKIKIKNKKNETNKWKNERHKEMIQSIKKRMTVLSSVHVDMRSNKK